MTDGTDDAATTADADETSVDVPPRDADAGPDETSVDVRPPGADAAADGDDGSDGEVGPRPRGPLMATLATYRQAADRLAGWLGWISAILIFPTVIISVVNVILRRLGEELGRSLTSNALIEAQWYLYGLMFVFGFAYILREGINVRVDFWFANRSSRTQSLIDLFGHLVALIPFAYIGIRYSWPSVQLSWQQNEQSPDAGGLARYPIKTALMVAFVFLLIQGLAEIIRNIEYLRGHEYRHESDDPALAGGQHLSVDDFDLSRGAGFGAGATTAERGEA